MSCAHCETDRKEVKKEPAIEKIYDMLSGLAATIIGGTFLAASLILVVIMKFEVPVDPAWVTVAICGFPLLYMAVWRVVNSEGMYKISAPMLMCIAMTAAIIIGELFAAGQVAFIMAIGGILEDQTVKRAQRGIKNLISLAPLRARIIKDGKENMIQVEQVVKGDILRVLPGEAIPVDGEIRSGDTSIDQSIITGESLPIDKTIGDNVYCGTINRFGSIDITATKVGEDSSLQKLIRLVEEAEDKRAPIQRIVDKWAAWLVPLALAIAVVTYFAARYMFLMEGDVALVRAVTVAIVFCPCALALATPTSIVAAIGQATKHGVIIKSGEALERMGKVDTIAFDKTGTLTLGNLTVSDVVSFDPDMSDMDILTLTASAEAHSEHPLGKAIVSHAKEMKIQIGEVDSFSMIPGKGISATFDERKVLCGNFSYLSENGIELDNDISVKLEKLRKQGKAAILIAYDGSCHGIIALSDTVRDTAKSMVAELKQKNCDAVLLTGDNKQTADYFAQHVSISSVFAELLPAQKVDRILQLQKEGRNVCMIGDGVNDAPALKTASVGVAMGSMGSDIAIEAADIALMGDDITKIPYLKRLSNATVSMIKLNISLAIVFNIIAITLSILGVLNPVTGALAHNAASILVVLNAALLYDRKYI